jgi:hypothetical protein
MNREGAPHEPRRGEPVLLDVRHEPLQAQAGWTLALLGSLEAGRAVEHLNTEVPDFLFPLLETRGIVYEILSRTPGEVRILM